MKVYILFRYYIPGVRVVENVFTSEELAIDSVKNTYFAENIRVWKEDEILRIDVAIPQDQEDTTRFLVIEHEVFDRWVMV